MSHADRDISGSSSKCSGTTPTGSVPSVLISAQVKAGRRELMERMPKEKKKPSGYRNPGVCAGCHGCGVYHSFLPTEAQGQIRLASDGQTEREPVSVGEDILAQQRGEMPTRCRGEG